MRRATVGLATLAVAAGLLLTGCGHGTSANQAPDPQLTQMQQKVDVADSAAAQADTDAQKGDN